jgi:hypothetical protein
VISIAVKALVNKDVDRDVADITFTTTCSSETSVSAYKLTGH